MLICVIYVQVLSGRRTTSECSCVNFVLKFIITQCGVIYVKLCYLCSGTEWASYNIGVFLCELCAQVHRSLGSHISKVKSLRLDTWDEAQIEVNYLDYIPVSYTHLTLPTNREV